MAINKIRLGFLCYFDFEILILNLRFIFLLFVIISEIINFFGFFGFVFFLFIFLLVNNLFY